MENKIKNICEFYAVTHKLKNTIRTGLKLWSVDAERLESVAEHIYGTQMLALAISCEFGLKLDIAKVALMLAIHELGECIIGDIPAVGSSITLEEKRKIEMEAVQKILGSLGGSSNLLEVFVEFEGRTTPEARFAYLVDKLECDFQMKFYEETGCNDINKARPQLLEERLQGYLKEGFKDLASIWITNDKRRVFGEEELFTKIADFIIENDIFKSVQ